MRKEDYGYREFLAIRDKKGNVAICDILRVMKNTVDISTDLSDVPYGIRKYFTEHKWEVVKEIVTFSPTLDTVGPLVLTDEGFMAVNDAHHRGDCFGRDGEAMLFYPVAGPILERAGETKNRYIFVIQYIPDAIGYSRNIKNSEIESIIQQENLTGHVFVEHDVFTPLQVHDMGLLDGISFSAAQPGFKETLEASNKGDLVVVEGLMGSCDLDYSAYVFAYQNIGRRIIEASMLYQNLDGVQLGHINIPKLRMALREVRTSMIDDTLEALEVYNIENDAFSKSLAALNNIDAKE